MNLDTALLDVQFEVVDDDEFALHVRQLNVEVDGESEADESAEADHRAEDALQMRRTRVERE